MHDRACIVRRMQFPLPRPIRTMPRLSLQPMLALLLLAAFHTGAGAQVLHDNGPLRTGEDDGRDGADTSAVQVGSEAIVTGYAANAAAGMRVADDVEVPAGGWLVSGVRVFAYQLGATPAQPGVDGASVRIWTGPPDAPGSTLLFDSSQQPATVTVTNADLYRVVGARVGDARRPIATVDVGGLAVVLRAGIHWIDWSFTGSREAGPSVPPVTRAGQPGSGNAAQRRGGAWHQLQGPLSGDELPFVLLGGPLPDELFADGFES